MNPIKYKMGKLASKTPILALHLFLTALRLPSIKAGIDHQKAQPKASSAGADASYNITIGMITNKGTYAVIANKSE